MTRPALLLLCLLVAPGPAWAIEASTPSAELPVDAPAAALAEPPPAASPQAMTPPRALTPPLVPYPDGAPAITEPVVVQVLLLIDADGSVPRVELLTPGVPVFDEAVLAAAAGFRFEPARADGIAVPVQLSFTHTFLPPPPPPATVADGPARTAALRGRLAEKGTRAPVLGATVAAELSGLHYTADADERGRFRLELPAGAARVTVHVPGYRPFLQTEELVAGEELAVSYYVERERYDPYEIVIVGEERREELSRITLRGAELKQVPGTFGDPFRVVQALPGVASVISLLPYVVVRGASPASTGYLIDGTRVPALYHLLAGPSVIHPEFIDEVQFYPGGAPVLYGGYTGGIIDGRTRRARPDEELIDVDLNLLQAGGLVRRPVEWLGSTVTVAARYGYPGFVMALATDEASLSYWDYQFRLDRGDARNGLTLFAFGSRDVLETLAPTADPTAADPELAPSLILGFHRLDLRLNRGSGALDAEYRLVTGYDETQSSGADLGTFVLEPSTRWRVRLHESLVLVAGLVGSFHDTTQGDTTTGSEGPSSETDLTLFTEDLSRQYGAAALTELLWRPTPRWLVRPGVRADLRNDGNTTTRSADPRLGVRYRLLTRELAELPADLDASGVWLKGGIGMYHQPPRFFLPLPGFDVMPLEYGLLSAIQSSLGVEVPLERGFGLDVQGFFHWMDPVVFDAAFNAANVNKVANTTLVPTSTTPEPGAVQEALDQLIVPNRGRAFGLETLLRREAHNGLYGWLSYTLSLSEREREGAWVPYDYDRTHLVNLVFGVPLTRSWDFGGRLQYQSGKPGTTTSGYNTARTDGYVRFDVRVDKRAVWNDWLLDFYVDLTNVALFPEEVAPGSTLRYVLPTVGVRGRL